VTDLELFTIEEVAARFRVSRRTLQAHIRRFPFYRLLGRRKLFTEADIARLYEALPCPSPSNRRAKAARRSTASGAPTSASMLTEALALLNEKQPTASVVAGSTKSSAARTSTHGR
jgi:excisionase family DNA binding protein